MKISKSAITDNLHVTHFYQICVIHLQMFKSNYVVRVPKQIQSNAKPHDSHVNA